jgi:release factor glutamine methyltransferase
MVAPRMQDDRARTWTVSDLLIWTERYFKRFSFHSPRLDAEILLAHAMGCTRLDLYTGYQRIVEQAERGRFRSFVERRARNEPVAYIIGEREFHSLKFEVNPSVFIPRPETEHLVDSIVEHLVSLDGAGPVKDQNGLQVLDLGTGSGNIAVSIAREIPGARILAVDISPEAIAVARRNAESNGLAGQIEFLVGDLYAPLRSLNPPPLFDAIASNPPYIALRERETLPADVRDFEPPTALFDLRQDSPGDGLGFHRALVSEAEEFLSPRGIFAVEVGAGQARAVENLFREAGFSSLETIADYGGIPRVVMGTFAHPTTSCTAPAPESANVDPLESGSGDS